MEVRGVLLILELGWLHVILQSAEVILAVLGLCVGLESFVERRALSLVVLTVDGRAGRFGERLTEEVFRSNLWNVTSVAWDMLRFQVLCRTAEPVFSLL